MSVKLKLKRSYPVNDTDDYQDKIGFHLPKDATEPPTLYDLAVYCTKDETDEYGEALLDFFAELELVDE